MDVLNIIRITNSLMSLKGSQKNSQKSNATKETSGLFNKMAQDKPFKSLFKLIFFDKFVFNIIV